MNASDVNAGQWMISLRASGEILTATAAEPAIELGVLGIPSGYSPAEIEGWLHDLIGVARETGREDAKPRPIPALLHHGLTGLLFSHAQLWNREGERHPASYALVRVDGVVAFGWIGDASVVTRVAGAPAIPGEIIVRDDEGREARAFELPDADAVDLRMEWPAGSSGDAGVVLEAHWPGAAAARAAIAVAAVTEPLTEALAPHAAAEASAPAPATPADPALRDVIETPLARHAAAEASAPAPAAPADPALRDVIETPLAPHLAPDVPIEPMEDIVRDAFPAYAAPAPSYLEPAGEPLDLGTPAAPAAHVRPEAPHPPVVPMAPDASPEPVAERPTAPSDAPMASAPIQAVARDAEPFEQTPEPFAADPAFAEVAPQFHEPLAAEQLSIEHETALATRDDAGLDDVDEERPAGAPGDATFTPEEEARPSRLRRLFARFTFWRGGAGPAPGATGDLPEGTADASAFGVAVAPVARDVPGVPEQVPTSPEPAELTARAVHGDPTRVRADGETQAGEETLVGAATLTESDAAAGPSSRTQLHDAPIAATVPAHAGATAPASTPAIEPHLVASTVSASAGAEAPPPRAGATRTPLRPQWPSAEELKPPAPLWKRPWVWGVVTAALFAGGWIIGHMNDERRAGAARDVRNVLRSVGLGGAHFEVMVNSRPPGAWISVNGEDLARRTPASIELEPGEHDVTLSFSELGAATFKVRGADGDRLTLDPPLWGSIHVFSSDEAVPVAVAVDGIARGFAPLRVDSLQPGAHEIRFSGPGLPSWGQTVQVRVNESADLIARPMTSPATGVIEVRAAMATETGTVDVEGAKVWLDSEPAGQTPLTLELPRGPHSIRVEHMGESAPVQLIDLPGGNQRFATFQLRQGAGFPTLAPLDPPAVVPLDRPTVVSMALDGVSSTEVREMWLHVQTPDGPWRRYQMAWLKSQGGVVGVAVFPTTLFGSDGRAHYYASASTLGGDEYFSEVRIAASPGAKPAPSAARRPVR